MSSENRLLNTPRNRHAPNAWHTLAQLSALFALSLLMFACQGQSNYISNSQKREIQTAYDSLQANYQKLTAAYRDEGNALPSDLRTLYSQMQQMHRQMDLSHHQMMSWSTGRNTEGTNKMRKQSMQMGMQMQKHMTGEWYDQMISMHRQMAAMHKRLGQQQMAKMNEHLANEFEKLTQMVPGLREPTEVPFNRQGNPDYLNGKRLFGENCSSCHGAQGEGIADAFPPLVDSKWVTGNKSIPIRIVLHGLSGEINVQGKTYRGIMPGFKARLSAAEITAILNYLRSQSDKDLPKITQDEVINTGNTYRQHTTPWTAQELSSDL